jgi:hypothetical protein
VFHLTEAPKPPEPRTETSGETALPVKDAPRGARRRWRWAIGFGAFGLVVLTLVPLQSRLPRPAPTSQPGQETHEAGSGVVVRPNASATAPQPEAKMQESFPSVTGLNATVPSATAPQPEAKKQELARSPDERRPSAGRPAITVKPSRIKKYDTPPPADHKQRDAPGISTHCTERAGAKFPFTVDVSAYSQVRRFQLIKESACWGDVTATELCCVRSKVD